MCDICDDVTIYDKLSHKSSKQLRISFRIVSLYDKLKFLVKEYNLCHFKYEICDVLSLIIRLKWYTFLDIKIYIKETSEIFYEIHWNIFTPQRVYMMKERCK
jgi:hypothetical protein